MDLKKLHVVVFPWLAHGHISHFLDLSYILAKDAGLRVSFVSTPRNISRIKRLLEPEWGHIDLVELPLPSVEGLRHGAESTTDVRVLKCLSENEKDVAILGCCSMLQREATVRPENGSQRCR
eukprot:Gb_21980 [translate_table: standard]